MADEIDQANDNIIRDVGIATRLASAFKSGIEYSGYCLSCKEPLAMPKRWCGADCRDEYDGVRLKTRKELS